MILHITDVQSLHKYPVQLTFNDSVAGVADLNNELWGERFEPVTDTQLFSQVKMDTIVWANGVDLAPKFLHNLIQPA